MKINWGTAIVIAFVLFAAFITYFMVVGSQNRADLVTEDYYDQEISYQQRINDKARAKELGQIIIEPDAENLAVVFPADFNGIQASGTIHFYKPDNANFDQKIELALGSNNRQVIDISNFIRGKWEIKISTKVDGLGYYWEESISL